MVENRTRLSLKKIILGILSLVVMASGLVGFISIENAKNAAEIEKVIKEAVIAAKELAQLPEPLSSDTKGKIPEDVKQKIFDKITAKYNEIYSSGSKIQETRIENLKNSILWQDSDHFRSLGGGIKKIENLTINLDGEKATAEADITTFATLKESNGKTFTPDGTDHYKFSLVKEDGRWKISEEEFSPLPGSEI